MKTNVYEQELTTEKYLYQSGLPKLEALTACFWLKLNDRIRGKTLAVVSLTTPGEWTIPNTHFYESTVISFKNTSEIIVKCLLH